MIEISFSNDAAQSQAYFESLQKENLLARLKALEDLSLREGCAALNPADRLVRIGAEIDPASGVVTKDAYGAFNLSWQGAEHPEWADEIGLELAAIRDAIRQVHNVPLKFLIWAGMGGSAEDKHAYQAIGLLKRGPRCYVLDSTDPAKLKFVLEDMRRRSRRSLPDLLRRTLVVGMALGMTSREPVVNLETLAALYGSHGIETAPNFLCLALPSSLLDRFAEGRGYKRIPLQMDGRNTVSGRTSSPLTRGSLYPLGLAGVDLAQWIGSTNLSEGEIDTAWRLSASLHGHIESGRDKITLVLPRTLAGLSVWTKQDFEESLGKSEQWGLKIVVGEKLRFSNYQPPRGQPQDRVFLLVQEQGAALADGSKVAMLKRAGYPVITLKFPRRIVASRYMQFIHYAVFGLAWLRDMNFVTQPGVELYKSLANHLSGPVWVQFLKQPSQAQWRGRVTLHNVQNPGTAPEDYARRLAASGASYAELTFFGDTRYSPHGRKLNAVLGRIAESLFRSRLKMPVDVYEGPAMNHSYHEMIIGHGHCFSTILIAEQAEGPADYHRAQFLATIQALQQRGRSVAGITLRDLSPSSIEALAEFFRQVAHILKVNHFAGPSGAASVSWQNSKR